MMKKVVCFLLIIILVMQSGNRYISDMGEVIAGEIDNDKNVEWYFMDDNTGISYDILKDTNDDEIVKVQVVNVKEIRKEEDQTFGIIIIPDKVLIKDKEHVVAGIARNAFEEVSDIQTVLIPDTVEKIDDSALPEDFNGKIYCGEKSAAELYAKTKKFQYNTNAYELNDTEIRLNKGEEHLLSIKENVDIIKECEKKWESQDEEIVNIDENGKISAVSKGQTKVICTYAGLQKSVDVIVTEEEKNETEPQNSETEKKGEISVQSLESEEEQYTYTISGEAVTITSYTGQESHVHIPDTIEGKTVKALAAKVFNGVESIVQIDIPDTINTIRDNAIYNCPNLEQINIYGNVSYSRYAVECPKLETVYLGPNVTTYNEDTKRILIKEYRVDSGNSKYKSIDGVLFSKEKDVLYQYPVEKKDVEYTFPDTTKQIESYSFYENKYLEVLNVTNLIDYKVDTSAFRDCQSLKRVTFTNLSGSFDMGAIDNCNALEDILLEGDGTAEIKARLYCENIKRVEFGNGIIKVSFNNWLPVTASKPKVYFGKDVAAIQDAAYQQLANLGNNSSRIEVSEENVYYSAIEGVLFSKDKKQLLRMPESYDVESYVVPDVVTEIEESAFGGNVFLKEVMIPSAVNTIKKYAFFGCKKMSQIYIPPTVQTIEENAFDDITIKGKVNSEAERYAKENNLPFVDVDAIEEAIDTGDYGKSIWSGEISDEISPIGDVYVVENAEQLAWVASVVNDGKESFQGKTIKLAADIDLDNIEWIPIGDGYYPFRGSFDGQNHTIYNLKVKTDTIYSGFFGWVSSRVSGKSLQIKRLKIKNIILENAKNYGGGLIGGLRVMKGTKLEVSQCRIEGEIVGGDKVGGVVGRIISGYQDSNIVIKNCNAVCNITTDGNAAGIVQGIEYDTDGNTAEGFGVTIDNCTYRGDIASVNRNGEKGGIVNAIIDDKGKGKYIISNCVAHGSITKATILSAGGIISGTGNGDIEIYRCVNYMKIAAAYYSGGIIGNAGRNTVIRECYNGGSNATLGYGGPNGGIVGENSGLVIDCFNGGGIIKSFYSGGICGQNHGTIERCYNASFVPTSSSPIYSLGAVAGWNGSQSYIKYSYFVDTAIEDENKKFKLCGANTGSESLIATSRELSSYELKTKSALETWDFDTVWEFDSEYCFGYPVLRGIKNKLKKQPDSEVHAISNKKNKAKFTVVDENGNKVKGATVIYGDENDGASGKTNEEGIVFLDNVKGRKGIYVEKEGYHTYKDNEFVMPSSKEYILRIISNEGAEETSLMSVMMTYNNNRYELLTEEKEINLINKDTKFTIECKLVNGDALIDHYEICQPDAIDEPIATSTEGKFDLKVGQFEVTKKGKKIRNVVVRVVDSQNESHDTKINLNIIKQESKEYTSIQFGKNTKIEIGKNVPFFGGGELNMLSVEFPVYATVSEDKWEIFVNVAKGPFKDSEKKKFVEFFKSEQTLMDSIEKVKPFLEGKDEKAVQNPDISFNVVGYASGDWPNPNEKIELTIYCEVSVKASDEEQAGVFVVAFDVSGKIKGSGKIDLDFEEGFKNGRVVVRGTVDGDIYGGVGLAHVASAGVYGEAELVAEALFQKKNSGPTEISLSGEMGIAVRAFGKKAFTLPLVDGTYFLYKRDASTERMLQKQSENLVGYQEILENSTSAESIDRSSYSSTIESWNGENASNSLLKENAYTDMQPQILQCNGKTVMVFLDDGGEDRSTDDKSTLMYSVYDETNNTWGTPEMVWDDKTADFGFSTYSDGKNGYVVWNNAKASLTGNEDLFMISKEMEVAVAKFNIQKEKFDETEVITNNNEYECEPKAVVLNDVPIICWTVNSDNNIWRTSGENTLYMAEKKEGWEIRKIASLKGTIVKDVLGSEKGKVKYAYIASEDGNLNNVSQYRPYVVSENGVEELVADESAINIYFQKLNSEEQIVWTNSDGNINYKSTDASSIIRIEQAISGNIRQIIEEPNGTKTVVIYTRNGKKNANAYMVAYDSSTDSWSKEIILTEENDYVEGVSGSFVNGNLILAYNQRKIDEKSDDYEGENSLYWKKIDNFASHLVVSEIDYNPYDIGAGEMLPLEITINNVGMEKAKKLHIIINDEENVYYDSIVEQMVEAGDKVVQSLSIRLPENLKQKEVLVTVTDPDNEELFDDAIGKFEVGCADLALSMKKYCVGGNYKVVVTVENTGYEDANGSIEIYDVSTGEIYETYDFGMIGQEDIVIYTTELLDINWDNISNLGLGARIVSESKQQIKANDDSTILILKDAPIRVEAMNMEKREVVLTEEEKTTQLKAHVVPEEADNPLIHWRSGDESIVTVEQDGMIMAHKGGVTKVYAESDDGNKIISCKVISKLPIRIEDIKLSKSEISLKSLEQQQVTATILPDDATIQKVQWSVEDESIACVDQQGNITGLQEGETKVLAAADGISAECIVKVTANDNVTVVEKINDFQSEHPYEANIDHTWGYVEKDASYVRITFSEDTYTESGYDYIYIYDINDTLIGRYSGGRLSGKSVIIPGNIVKIRLTSDSLIQKEGFTVTNIEGFQEFPIQDFRLSEDEVNIKIEDEGELTVEDILPQKNAADIVPIEWHSSDESLLTVNDGIYFGKKAGDAVITVKIGNVEKQCIVHVSARDFYIVPNEEYRIKNGEVIPELEVRDSDTDYLLDEYWDYRINIKDNTVTVIGRGAYLNKEECITVEKVKDTASVKPSIIRVSAISVTGISKKIAAGKKITLTAKVSPKNASNKAVTWKSSNTKVATVNSSGVVTMKKKSGGKSVTITAIAKDGSGVKATYKIKTMKGVVKKVSVSGKKTVKAGKTLKLKGKVTATKGANKKLKWTSSNTKYAKVTSSGKVKTYKAGKGKKVKITAMATDGTGKKKSVTIKIK